MNRREDDFALLVFINMGPEYFQSGMQEALSIVELLQDGTVVVGKYIEAHDIKPDMVMKSEPCNLNLDLPVSVLLKKLYKLNNNWV